MKKTFIFVCLALAFPLLAWAGKWEPTDQALYDKFKADATVRPTYDMAFKELGPPNEQNADKWRGVMSAYMMSTNKVDPDLVDATKKKLAQSCGSGKLWDGSKCVDSEPVKAPGKTGNLTVGKETPEQKAAREKAEKEKAEKEKAVQGPEEKAKVGGPPPLGDTPVEEKKADDPNKWNSTIAGGKMAIWAGFIGLILAGPAGMLLAACVGFGAGYFIKEMS
jgi:hypothetical protein